MTELQGSPRTQGFFLFLFFFKRLVLIREARSLLWWGESEGRLNHWGVMSRRFQNVIWGLKIREFNRQKKDRRWLSSKESTCQTGDMGSIPGLGRSSGEGNGNPLLVVFPGNPMDRGAQQAPVHGGTKSWSWLNAHTWKGTEQHSEQSEE